MPLAERLKEQGPFALVILDVRMPGEPGIPLSRVSHRAELIRPS